MYEENKRLAQRALDEVFSAGDMSAVDEIFARDFVNHEAGPQTPPGREGLKVTVRWMRSAFSDMRYEVEDAIAEDDKVVLRVISRGRHAGDFMGFPATGREFAVKQIHVYRVVDGKILEHWAVRDDLGQGIQLGFVPGPGGASSEGPQAPPTDGHPAVETARVPVGGGIVLAEQRVVFTQPHVGQFRAFSAICTHMGCTVGEVSEGLIKCPCHGSQYAIADGTVVRGPAARALASYGVRVAGDTITVVEAAPIAQ